MDKLSVDNAVELLKGFLDENGIGVLNVAGSRASKDALIYDRTFLVVEMLMNS